MERKKRKPRKELLTNEEVEGDMGRLMYARQRRNLRKTVKQAMKWHQIEEHMMEIESQVADEGLFTDNKDAKESESIRNIENRQLLAHFSHQKKEKEAKRSKNAGLLQLLSQGSSSFALDDFSYKRTINKSLELASSILKGSAFQVLMVLFFFLTLLFPFSFPAFAFLQQGASTDCSGTLFFLLSI